MSKCKKCGSLDLIVDLDGEILTYCDDCGYIQDQKKAAIEYEEELKGEQNDDM